MSESATPGSTPKPRISYFIATACGLGYLPKAPGTFGAFGGLLLTLFFAVPFAHPRGSIFTVVWDAFPWLLSLGMRILLPVEVSITILIAIVGVIASGRVARSIGQTDPQFVVIDEVSGVSITLLLGLAAGWYPPHLTRNPDFLGYNSLFLMRLLNWKYLLLGFILFRLFDIWKPFPARQAESLPGGWGIMADDWIAGVYAAFGLWLARAVGM
ncbi:MAG: phosphatidylglycerophosphatase A family protein [Candidatus Acidiferrales bacterium]